jgi:hypothetical protein
MKYLHCAVACTRAQAPRARGLPYFVFHVLFKPALYIAHLDHDLRALNHRIPVNFEFLKTLAISFSSLLTR